LSRKRLVLTNLTIAINLEISVVEITRTIRARTRAKNLKTKITTNKTQLLSLSIKVI